MIDLRAKPFYLDDESVKWVEDTLNGMTLMEKVGQVFAEILWDKPGYTAEQLFEYIQPGTVMLRPHTAAAARKNVLKIREIEKYPTIVSMNLECGGNGGAGGLTDATYIASPLGAAATDDPAATEKIGLCAAREGGAVGINWTYEPVCDIIIDRDNPITNVRSYGEDADTVIKFAKGYIKSCMENQMASTVKHFPGDGVDFRDQHLLCSVNSLPLDEWYASYGKIYKELIDFGVPTIMCGHIRQPELSRKFHPGIKDEDIMPMSLASEKVDVLRGEFGFNGLLVSDATNMVGYTCMMPREKAIPLTIENGADIILFTVNQKEDVGYLLDGLKNGLLSQRRLDEAVTRVLALKASMNMHRRDLRDLPEEGLSVVKCEEHENWAREINDQCICKVKDLDNIFPLTPEKYPTIQLVVISKEPKYSKEIQLFKSLLEKEGFKVKFFEECEVPSINYSLKQYKEQNSLIIYCANMKVNSAQISVRITWEDFLGEDSPKYIFDIPGIFISFSNPYHLIDVPHVRTYINAYTSTEYSVKAVVEKMMGRSEFKGVSHVDAFCGLWDSHL